MNRGPATAPRRLRIAMVGSKGIPARHGGIERHVEEIACRLAQRGHAVDVFTRSHHPVRAATLAGVRLRRRPSFGTKHLDAASHTALCTLEVLASRRYDILHVHGIGPGLFLAWARRQPTVFTYHAQDWRQRKWGRLARWFLRRGEATAVRRAGALIAVSRLLQGYLQTTYGRSAHYIPNGASCHEGVGQAALGRWELAPRTYLLFVGRILADRGLGTLLEAFATLPTRQRLVIVGDKQVSAAAMTALRGQADPRVIFTGYQSGEVLQQLYANATLCVHPSEVEGLPIAVLEAMAHGRAVLVSDIPENLEAVGPEGLSFPVGNPDALRRVLELLLGQPERLEAVGRRGRDRVLSSYNWDDITAATEAVYLDLVAGR